MAVVTEQQTVEPADSSVAPSLSAGRYRWLVLAAGAVLALLGTGEPYSVAVAAWLAPVLLLRFVRCSRVLPGLGAVLLVVVAASTFWGYKLVGFASVPTLVAMALTGAATALPYAADRLLGRRLSPLLRLVLFPAVLVCAEFALVRFSSWGAIHGLLVNTQLGDLPLLQIGSVTGPFGVGFLIGAFATVVNHVWEKRPNGRRVALAYALVLTVVVVAGSASMSFAAAPTARTVRIAGITPNKELVIDQYTAVGGGNPSLMLPPRTDPSSVPQQTKAVLDDLFGKTQAAAQAGAKIVMWSETSANISETNVPGLLARAQRVAQEQGIYLEIAPSVYRPGQQDLNETFLIGPDGKTLWNYIKTHPVPGAEEDQYGQGNTAIPVAQTPYGRISSVICFDGDFPAMLHIDTDIMLIPSADWPQDSPAHTQLSALRGIENGYAVVRTDSNGQSAAFDRQGRVLSVQDTTGDNDRNWYVDVPTQGTTTIYRTIGDTFAWLNVLAALALTAIVGWEVIGQRPTARSHNQDSGAG